MLEIGRVNTLQIHHVDASGAWLQADGDQVLLPKREVPEEARAGSRIEVFVFRDGTGKVVATSRKPRAQLGQFALLRVSQVGQPGAFLDWGLDKDLLVPYSEQPERMREGRRYLVRVCLDNRARIVGTARIDRCLETEQITLQEGEEVDVMIWQFTDLGAKVIINDLYGGLLYRDELPTGSRRGDRFRGYVKQVREDRKIDVSLRKTGVEGIEEAKQKILAALEPGGFLPLNDQSPPELIQARLGISKKAFKKAIGGLYKAGAVQLTAEGIRSKTGGAPGTPQRSRTRKKR